MKIEGGVKISSSRKVLLIFFSSFENTNKGIHEHVKMTLKMVLLVFD